LEGYNSHYSISYFDWYGFTFFPGQGTRGPILKFRMEPPVLEVIRDIYQLLRGAREKVTESPQVLVSHM
jgi:hypothetical protein